MAVTRRGPFLWFALALMMLGAGFRLTDEFHRLVADQSETGAIDLRHRFEEVAAWFSGADVYDAMRTAVYPPASYALLWPVLGWPTWPVARVLWAVTTVGALAWLIALTLRAVPSTTWLERACAVFLVLSIHGTGGTIGNGQLLLHVLPALIGGAMLLRRVPSPWRDALASVAFLWATVKPNAATPFLWLVLVLPQRLRPTVMVAAGYLGLTAVGLAFRTESTLALLLGWLRRLDDVDVFTGYGDAHSWLTQAGLEHLRLPFSLVATILVGAWVWQRRQADIWTLLGVFAIVARVSAYHRPYDDALILIPMIALARMVLMRATALSTLLLVAAWAGAMAPAHYVLNYAPAPIPIAFEMYQSTVWVAMLVFLCRSASGDEALGSKRSTSPRPSFVLSGRPWPAAPCQGPYGCTMRNIASV